MLSAGFRAASIVEKTPRATLVESRPRASPRSCSLRSGLNLTEGL